MAAPSESASASEVFGTTARPPRQSISGASEDSQTAAEFISSQLKLEAEAREALPYKFDTCTRPLGSLRQLLFACLTCNPPPTSPSETHTPAAVCYSCSVSCHGEHTLVELFNKRNFVCDCGTTRIPSTSPCNLRINPETNQKGGVVSEPADPNNKYNQNFRNRFCGCECDYDAHQQKGTMFQCLGLGSVEDGGCGEDWYHAGCIVGLSPSWYEDESNSKPEQGEKSKQPGILASIAEVSSAIHRRETEESTGLAQEDNASEEDDDDPPTPPGFPHEDEFEGFICYKCVDANPWIKQYAGTEGFLEPVFRRSAAPSPEADIQSKTNIKASSDIFDPSPSIIGEEKSADGEESMEDRAKAKTADDIFAVPTMISKKRKADDDDDLESAGSSKRLKDEELNLDEKSISTSTTDTLDKVDSPKHKQLPSPPPESLSLFFKSNFRQQLCHCSDCFPLLAAHPQLLEEEENYEPPVSEDSEDAGGSTVGSGSLLDRGERALTNVDRVRAIEGVMAYNHLKEKLKPFFKEFAESGKAISAEDIKAHFAKMRGDEEAIKEAGEAAASSVDNRKEQGGY